jgi:periplasmic protein CpxP/Spy
VKLFHPLCSRVAVTAIAVSLLALSAPVLSQPPHAHDPAARQQHVQSRLDRMAQQLQITPAQQDAWNAYANTVKSAWASRSARPAPDADAATLLRARAQRTAAQAQRLTQLADATAELQPALSAEQRKTLDDMVRRHGRHRHHGHGKYF